MNLIIALCLLCGCVAPYACRSVDVRDSTSQDLEPIVTRRHREGNIAELLIPLLERSLAQSEARSIERQHRRNKPGKKVIQVLPYRGSEEHKRKGWRKLNSHKKQVVEITPLHGKNGAKPLAYILSAAKPSHVERAETNDDASSASVSDIEQDKYTSEEPQSSEENVEDVKASRKADSASPSAASTVQSSEDESEDSKEGTLDREHSADDTIESIADASAAKSGADNKVVVVEESDEDSAAKSRSGKKHPRSHVNKAGSVENRAVSVEDAVPVEDAGITAEDAGVYVEDRAVTEDDDDVEVEADVIVENRDVSRDGDATAEDSNLNADLTSQNDDVTLDTDLAVNRAVTVEADVTGEDTPASGEDEEDTSAAAVDKTAPAEDNLKVERRTSDKKYAVTLEDGECADRTATAEADAPAENADVTAEDDLVEKKTAEENTRTHHTHTVGRTQVNNEIPDINSLINNYNFQDKVSTIESDAESKSKTAKDSINDIVINKGQSDSDSVEKNLSKLINARDIIELIQSSAEESTQSDCTQRGKHNHDHKSYRLSFLFNKK